MYILNQTEELSFQPFFEILVNEAKKAMCTRSKCGSIIVKDGEIIGK
jgi:deoxycytidylate deaminase